MAIILIIYTFAIRVKKRREERKKDRAEQRFGGGWSPHLIQKARTLLKNRLPLAWILEPLFQTFPFLHLFPHS